MRIQSEALESVPSDREGWKDITSRGNQVREKLARGITALSKQIALINLDVSVGRLGPADLRQINAKLQSVLVRAAYVLFLFAWHASNVLDRGLNSFQNAVNEINLADEEEKTVESLSRGDATPGAVDRFQNLRRKIRERENQHGHQLDSLVPLVASSSVYLRSASENGVTCIIDWIQECNGRRLTTYFSKPDTGKIKERHDKLVDQLNELKTALEEFRSVHKPKMIEPYQRFFDTKTKRLVKGPGEKDMFSLRCVYFSVLYHDEESR